MRYHSLRTESPSSLNESNIRVMNKERDRALEVIRLRLEVSVKYGYVVAKLHVVVFHALFESSCFVAISIVSPLTLNVHAFTFPFCTFRVHQLLIFNPFTLIILEIKKN